MRGGSDFGELSGVVVAEAGGTSRGGSLFGGEDFSVAGTGVCVSGRPTVGIPWADSEPGTELVTLASAPALGFVGAIGGD